MFKNYRQILSYPGTKLFTTSALIARIPMAAEGISILLMISLLYNEYSLAGSVNAVIVISYAIVNPILARLCDQYGQAKIMRPMVVILTLVMSLLAWAALTHQPAWVLYLLAACAGGTTGSFGALVRARWISVLKTPKELNSAFALEAAFDEVIFIFAPVIATTLVTVVHPIAGLIMCILSTFIGGLWFLSLKGTEPLPKPAAEHSADERKSLFRSGAMVVLCVIFSLCGLTFGALDISVVAFCRELNKPELSGPLLAIMGIGSLASALIYGSRDWKISALRLFLGGIGIMALSFSLFIFATDFTTMVICMIVTGITYAPTMTNAANLLQRIVPDTRFTEGMAWFNTAFTIGISLGTFITGRVLDQGNWYSGMMVVVVCAWLMFVIVCLGVPPLRISLRRAREREIQRRQAQEEQN